ncbi:MAG: hypothetical protein RR664_06420, partial [Clostridia bacterium]
MDNELELYILSNETLETINVNRVNTYNINLDEETNNKSEFVIFKPKEKVKKGQFIYLNGLYKPFYFIIDNAISEKNSNKMTITASDITNIFNRKVIEKRLNLMKDQSLEQFIGETILSEFVNNDAILSINYINVSVSTFTKTIQATNAENMIYNFHTFLTNCRQNKNIYTDISINPNTKKMNINITYKENAETLIDTTVSEVVNYNKIYDVDPVTKVTAFCRDTQKEVNLYLKSDNTTTTNANDGLRIAGRVDVISVDQETNALNEALNVIKGNRYKHLVEFDIKKSSKLVDTKILDIGTLVRIKTEDDIYSSYISAISLNNNEYIKYKSGNLRVNLVDKLKQKENSEILNNKLDITGGNINGNLSINGMPVL